MNWYKHYLGDYDGDTSHLSWDEDMAYTRLLRTYYRREKPIPPDPGITYRLVRANTRAEKSAVTRVLHEFFTETDAGWTNSRADKEIAAYNTQCEINRALGKLGGRPKRTESVSESVSESEPNRNPNQNQNQNQNQKEQTTEEVAMLPPWLPSEAWKGWLEVRRKNKAPNTPRALNLALQELTRLKSQGFDPCAVLDQSTVKGWKSLYPPKDGLPVSEPAGKLCDYCTAVASGQVNGRRACNDHWSLAMDNESPVKRSLGALGLVVDKKLASAGRD